MTVNKKLIAFDLDGTLADSKSPVPTKIVEMLKGLLKKYEVAIISGGAMAQFEQQLFKSEGWGSAFSSAPKDFSKLHILPTCGGRYYIFTGGKWVPVYKEDFSAAEIKKILTYLNWVIEERELSKLPTWGEQIENRGSQITFSALGQSAPSEAKARWDPKENERRAIKKILELVLPEFEIKVGGSTSIDITKKGIDKAFGMNNLMEYLNLSPEDIVFFGDKLQEGGNDFPVVSTGIECIEVNNWKHLLIKIEEARL